MGLFTPVWLGQNTNKALAYVQKCSDETKLLRILRETRMRPVKEAAVQKITDQNALYAVVRENWDTGVADAALEKITDAGLLTQIAVESRNGDRGKCALVKISDPACLYEVAQKASVTSVRAKAASRLEQPDQLAEIARRDSSAEVRETAVKKLSSLKNPVGTAEKMVSGQQILAGIAVSDISVAVRRAAMSGITDRSTRLAIALKDKNESVRAEAAYEMGDQKAVTEFGLRGRDWETRQWAAERITDQKILEQIARDDESETVRRTARLRISDPHIFLELTMKDGSVEEQRKLVQRLTDRDDLMRMTVSLRTQEAAIAQLRRLGLLDENELAMGELELTEHCFRQGLELNDQMEILGAYNLEETDALQRNPCEEAITALILMLRKNPTAQDPYYSEIKPSPTANRVEFILRRFYNHPELRESLRKVNRYSVDVHMDHGSPSCHEDAGPLIFDFK